MKIKYML